MTILLLLVVGLGAAASPSDRWTTYRGGPLQSGVSSTALPGKLELLWKHEMGEAVGAGVAIANGTVFVGAENGRLRALALATGAQLWEYKIDDAFSGPISVIQGRVYAGDDLGTLHVLDEKSGARLWTLETGGAIHSSVQPVPAVSGENNARVLVGSDDGLLYCVDSVSGGIVWRYAAQDRVYGTPAIVDGAALFSGCDGYLHAVRLADGAYVARAHIGSPSASSAAVLGRRVFMGTHGSRVHALDLPEKVDFERLIAGAAAPTSQPASAPASAPSAGKTSQPSAATTSQPSAGAAISGASATPPEVDAPGVIRAAWIFEPTERAQPFMSSPAVANGVVVIGGRDRRVWALDAKTGAPRWSFATRKQVEAPAVIAGERVFVGGEDGVFYELRMSDGKMVWEFETGEPITAGPAVADGRIVVGNNAGSVFCFGGK